MSDQQLQELPGLYDETELAILCDWLGRDRPAELSGIDLMASIQSDLRHSGPVRLLSPQDGMDYGRETLLANALARIALNAIANRLPQWAASTGSGEMVFGRQHQPRRGLAIEPLPRFLLMINWADSGPGYSWPESYHATWLPGFECFVVTLSADSPDVHGYTDMALDHFPASGDFDAEVERILCTFWSDHTDSDWERAWKEVWRGGHVDINTAYDWRERLWGIDQDGEPVDQEPQDWED